MHVKFEIVRRPILSGGGEIGGLGGLKSSVVKGEGLRGEGNGLASVHVISCSIEKVIE